MNRSAYAFKSGERGGSFTGSSPNVTETIEMLAEQLAEFTIPVVDQIPPVILQ